MHKRFATLFLSLLLACAPAAMAQTLYGTTAGNTGSGNLLTINTSTGAATVVGPLVDGSGNHYAVTGIAFQPGTGVLYGSTSAKSTTAPASLVTINPSTGRVTLIGTMTSDGGPVADITFTPDGKLWGWWEPSEDRLVSINLSTGAATALGSNYLGTAGSGIASDGSGTIYYFGEGDGGEFDTLNKATGQPTNVGTLSNGPYGGDGEINAAAFSPGGVLYLSDNGGKNSPNSLVTLNVATGAITTIGVTDPNLDGLAFQVTAAPSVPASSTWVLILLAIMLAGIAALRFRPSRSI